MITRCEEIRPLLTGYALKEVGAAEAERIQGHVDGCLSCRQELAGSRAMLGLLERAAVMEDMPRNIRVVSPDVSPDASPEASPEAGRARAGWLSGPGWWADFWNHAGRLAFSGGALACLAVGLMGVMNAHLRYDADGFELAFGSRAAAGTPMVTMSAPAPPPVAPATAGAGLSREQVELLIAAALRASEQRQLGETSGLIRQAAFDAAARRDTDLQQMAETFRYMQAAQTNMWKEQVQSQQIVAMLAQKNGVNLSQ